MPLRLESAQVCKVLSRLAQKLTALGFDGVGSKLRRGRKIEDIYKSGQLQEGISNLIVIS